MTDWQPDAEGLQRLRKVAKHSFEHWIALFTVERHMKSQPVHILACNTRERPEPIANLRGPGQHIRYPLEADELLYACLVQPLDPEGSFSVPVTWVMENLNGDQARTLNVAISQIMQVQRIDAVEAVCFIVQLHLMNREWKNYRAGRPLLLDEARPTVPDPSDVPVVVEETVRQYHEHMLPVTSIDQLCRFWVQVGGHHVGGVSELPQGYRPNYTRIPIMALAPNDVILVYGMGATENSLIIERGVCRITYADVSKTFRADKGFIYIAELVANPGPDRYISALELVQLVEAVESSQAKDPDLTESTGAGRGNELADEETIENYRNHLKGLLQVKVEIEAEMGATHESDDDPASGELDRRHDEVTSEIDFIEKFLRDITFQGGRKVFSGDARKATNSVGNAINRARVEIRRELPLLEDHLRMWLSTGSAFKYWPVPPVNWRIER